MEQEGTTQLQVILPEEVQAIALSVSEEKRAEVSSTLSQVFAGTADWKAQVEAIAVAGPDDKLGMKLANTARLNAKNARLAAEKLFDQKRDEVQAQMLSYQTEDKLWLKAKQTMIILFKEIEQAAEYKEKTAERYEKEQHELVIQARLAKLASVNPDITRQEIDAMSDVSFEAFYAGLVAQKIEAEKVAKEEAERIRQIELRKERDSNRFKILASTGLMFSNGIFAKNENIAYNFSELCELDDDTFIVKVREATDKIAEYRVAEIKEKERLESIAKAKEKELEEERKKADAERKLQAETLRIQQEKAAAEKAKQDAIIAKQKAELEAKQKQEAETKAAEEKRMADEKAEAERLAKAPKKEQLTKWIDGIVVGIPVELANEDIVREIMVKFAGFKKWAIGEISKL